MSFILNKTDEFLANFDANKEKIRAFNGCLQLDLLRDTEDPSIFFTYSLWTDDDALQAYRRSDLFKGIWASTKLLFNGKPEAWSLDKLTN